jgi:hypothetical protein
VLDALDASGEGLPTAVTVLAGLGSAGGRARRAAEMIEKAGLFGARRSSIDRNASGGPPSPKRSRDSGSEAARAIRHAAEATKDEAERRRLDGSRGAPGAGSAAS